MEKRKIMKKQTTHWYALFSALRKDIVDVLDFLENEENQKALGKDQVEKLKLELAFICTYVQLSYSDLEQFEDIMTRKRQEVENLLQPILDDDGNNFGCEYVLTSLAGNMDDCISSHHRSKSDAIMMDEQLDFLLLNLYHLSKHRAEKMFPGVTQYEVLQNICGNVRDFHGLIVNGYIKHEIVEYVLPQFQLMAERVGNFLWEDQIDEDSKLSQIDEADQTDDDSQLSELDDDDQNDRDCRLFKLAHLLLKIVPTELEVMHICFTNLKASTSAEVGRFIKKLLETSPDILREYLIHLQEHMVTFITPSTSRAQNIHVMMEFLLIILSAMPKDFICHDKLFDLLARVGALTRELENIELLKKDLKHVYLKSHDSSQCCFPMNDGPLFMHQLYIHLNDLLDSNAYSIALIREEIELVKQDLEFIRSFLVNVEQEMYKDLWAHGLDVAYELKYVIDSIIVRDNCLSHLIFSLPITIKKMKLIKEEVSDLHEKIPKNMSIIVVNTLKKPVKSNSLTTGKIIVDFEEETNWLLRISTYDYAMNIMIRYDYVHFVTLRKLTSGPADLDVISITGMPGSGKTTLAYKVYNDKLVSSHFDLRAWCTVDQGYDEKKLLGKIFNQVSDSDSKLSENIDVADKLRKQLYGKRAFGKESCPDDLLDVGKEIVENCKGLPLVADMITGVIAGREKKRTVWLEVQNNLSSFILNSEVEVMRVIELSYDHLPHHLKPCFLYLASILKDTALKISFLKAVWSAEGLVEQTEIKSVKEVMDNLISSSLVILFNEIGDEPSCQLHDLVHDFCLIKAREEKLVDQISSSTPSSSSSSSDLMPRIVTIHYNSELLGLNNFVLFDSNKKRHSGKHMYSLTIDGDKWNDCLSDTFHLRHLRLLRVLYLDPSFIKVNDSLLNEI
ncbi:hypothetical protein H5410_029909 [Solanum commersonii]|uniref:NB-ARC domain-containing protein n=1 Tax=Solanum commersonii TaxID=4109 RepID=A0A9J5YCT6_SOLCO|nr:hypothetical protein H5410_029909 [Solanum commersonii]